MAVTRENAWRFQKDKEILIYRLQSNKLSMIAKVIVVGRIELYFCQIHFVEILENTGFENRKVGDTLLVQYYDLFLE